MSKNFKHSSDPCSSVDKDELIEEIKRNFSELLRRHVSEEDETQAFPRVLYLKSYPN